MCSIRGRARRAGGAFVVVLVVAILGVVVARGGAGPQSAVGRLGDAGDSPVLRGSYYVQLKTREDYSIFEDVRLVILKPDWVILELMQDDQISSLMLPREAVSFIKSWENKEEEGQEER